MKYRDARTLSPEAKEEIRRQAIRMHQAGCKNIDIAQALEVHRSTVSVWVSSYKKSGFSELKKRTVGRRPGSGMQLSQSEQKTLRKKIQEKNPEQLKMPFALWTREAVGQLILRLTGKLLDLRQVGRYLARWLGLHCSASHQARISARREKSKAVAGRRLPCDSEEGEERRCRDTMAG